MHPDFFATFHFTGHVGLRAARRANQNSNKMGDFATFGLNLSDLGRDFLLNLCRKEFAV